MQLNIVVEYIKKTASALCLVVCLVLASGCSTAHYRESADKEVYRTISEKTAAVPAMPGEFTIEPVPSVEVTETPTVLEVDATLGEVGEMELGAHVITLEDAMELAFTKSRTYQNRKEGLYLQALSLTLDRHQYTPIFSGGVSTNYTRSTRDVTKLSGAASLAQSAPDVVTALGNLAGTPAGLLSRYAAIVDEAATVTGINQPRSEIMNERSVSGSTDIGVGLLMKGGAQVAVGLSTNLLRFLTGDPRVSTSSALAASIRQPLLRGRGKVAEERLTQAERNLLYELRDFTRFRKEFSVQIASEYYNVLQDRDVVRNSLESFEAFQRNAQRERAFAREGRRTQTQVGQLEQAELEAQTDLINAVRNYRRSVDEFKITLGLPTDAEIVLADKELDELRQQGLRHPDVTADDAAEVALVARLDLYTVRDQEEDSARTVEIAENQLLPDLDLIVRADVDNVPEADRFQELDFQRATWSAGLDVDLPLDRKSERNSYRTALINHERARRALELAEDEIKLQVREAWRNLDQAKRNYEISEIAVELNKRRVEEMDLRAELGLATARDLIEAQQDLTSTLNSRTRALVAHTIARLQFWRDMGILYIKENGQWEDITDVEPVS